WWVIIRPHDTCYLEVRREHSGFSGWHYARSQSRFHSNHYPLVSPDSWSVTQSERGSTALPPEWPGNNLCGNASYVSLCAKPPVSTAPSPPPFRRRNAESRGHRAKLCSVPWRWDDRVGFSLRRRANPFTPHSVADPPERRR